MIVSMEWLLIVLLIGAVVWLLIKLQGGGEKESRIIELQTQLDGERERREQAEKSARQMQTQHTQKMEHLNLQRREDGEKSAATIAELEANLQNVEKSAQEKLAELRKVRDTMTAEFKNLSQAILEENSAKFGADSKKLLQPLSENLEQFRKRVDEIHTAETTERASLKTEIKNLHENAMQISREANNLAVALKGDSKTQGDWGEIELAALLEKAGLREGEGYETQKSLRDEDGKLNRPDVVIKLPDNRHFVVDSKISLRAFADAMAAEAENERQASLKNHVLAVKKHVDELAAKNYQHLQGINAPDMVFMFMAVEPAFIAALMEDVNLFNDAYQKGVALCSPTTLMPVLRSTEHIWRLDKQNRNAEDIARRGGLLYDKFVGFVEDMTKAETALQKALTAHQTATKKLSSAPGNLITQANQLRELGVSTKKPKLPTVE